MFQNDAAYKDAGLPHFSQLKMLIIIWLWRLRRSQLQEYIHPLSQCTTTPRVWYQAGFLVHAQMIPTEQAARAKMHTADIRGAAPRPCEGRLAGGDVTRGHPAFTIHGL